MERVFVGAGAVGSTRIVLQSKKLYNHNVRLQSTLAFVAPMLRMKKLWKMLAIVLKELAIISSKILVVNNFCYSK